MGKLNAVSLKLSLLLNTGAGVWNRGSGALIRLVQVPLLLSALGVNDYGRWLVLSTLPSWLMLASFGFGSVAANEMSMSVAAGDIKSANNVFSSTISLVLAIGFIGSIAAAVISPFIKWESFLNFPPDRHDEIALAVTFMAIAVFVSFLSETLLGRYRAAKKAHLAVFIISFGPWLDLLGIIVALKYSHRFDCLGFAMLASTTLFFLVYLFFSWRVMPQISFSLKKIEPHRFKYLFKKGAAFQAFPLGNALLFQGNLLVVQAMLGPAAVAIFGTARTLVRTVNQVMEVINQAIWPELSHLFGSGDLKKAAKLHRGAVGISILLSLLGVISLAVIGRTLYGLWVGKSIELSQELLVMFLLPIPLNALWFTSSVVHMASNQYEGLAVRYLIAAALAGIACAILSYFFGIEGAALSTMVVDILLIPYVLKRSIEMVNDSWSGFLNGILSQAKHVLFNFRSVLRLSGSKT
ncbi:MAG: lipopolysaccharide biosynthesis protein [Sphingobacteriaceae bacterium]|nr:lipopolysaccharide biosynthesis protein [Sphingobacteriaceae bacterium]